MDWSRTISHDHLGPRVAPGHEPSAWRLPRNLYRALTRDDPIAHRYLLLLRFILANVGGLALASSLPLSLWPGSHRAARGVA